MSADRGLTYARSFEYLTPPILIYPNDIDTAPHWMHMVSMLDRTKTCLSQRQPGVLVAWEPEPVSCTEIV